jgi:hypothetical protein
VDQREVVQAGHQRGEGQAELAGDRNREDRGRFHYRFHYRYRDRFHFLDFQNQDWMVVVCWEAAGAAAGAAAMGEVLW